MTSATTFRIITIDGGAASGKSSTAVGLAAELDLLHVDTGAHYRTLTRALLQADADPGDPENLPSHLQKLNPETEIRGRTAHLRINGEIPPAEALRTPEINAHVSTVAAVPAVRRFLLDYQRSQAALARDGGFNGLVMEGRDIGSVIFPDADFRFFLFADEATRAARRREEGQEDSVAARDQRDSQRPNAPLVRPPGAIEIDTGRLSLPQVIARLRQTVESGKTA